MVEVVNLRNCSDWGKPGDICIDRQTKWGNPFKMYSENDRDDVIKKYEDYFITTLLKDIHEISHAKRLGCWCKPKACHGDIIKKYIDITYHPTCPHCGSKGHKKPHTIIIETIEAKKYGWNNSKCGSCGRSFKSY
jgi:hypothetical protein